MPWKYQTLHCLIINKTWLHRTSSIWVFEDSQIPKWVFFFELVKITQIIPFIQNWLYLRIFFIQHLFEPYVELLTIFSWILNYCRAIHFYRRETLTIQKIIYFWYRIRWWRNEAICLNIKQFTVLTMVSSFQIKFYPKFFNLSM